MYIKMVPHTKNEKVIKQSYVIFPQKQSIVNLVQDNMKYITYKKVNLKVYEAKELSNGQKELLFSMSAELNNSFEHRNSHMHAPFL